MAKPVIAVDIDDVLADNAAAFVAFSNERWGTHLAVEDFKESWGEIWLTDMEETQRRALEYLQSGVVGDYVHDDSALSVLQHLSGRYSLVVVTARRRFLEAETTGWLDRHFSGIFENVHYAGIWDEHTEHSSRLTKADILKDVAADYLIDDQLKHCEAAAAIGIQALLFGNYRWNECEALSANVTRVSGWTAVEEFFDERAA